MSGRGAQIFPGGAKPPGQWRNEGGQGGTSAPGRSTLGAPK